MITTKKKAKATAKKKDSISSLIKLYRPELDAANNDNTDIGWSRYNLYARVITRLETIERYAQSTFQPAYEKRAARDLRIELVKELREFNCLPHELKKENCQYTFDCLKGPQGESTLAYADEIDRRGKFINVNILAKNIADRIEAVRI